jgi:hypothetical protein
MGDHYQPRGVSGGSFAGKQSLLLNVLRNFMQKLITAILPFCAMLVASHACKQEEDMEGDRTGIFIHLRYPEQVDYDSAFMVLKDSVSEIRYKLTLDNQTYIATGYIPGIPVGDRKVSIAYYNKYAGEYQHSEKTGVANIRITPTITDIVSDDVLSLQVKDQNGLVTKPIAWTDYYYFRVENNIHKKAGFARIPQDPMNPFIEVAMTDPAWEYIFVDRTFYHIDYFGFPDLQWIYVEGGAMEIYDAHLVDTTAFARDNTRYVNFVDMIIVAYGADADDEVLLYYAWDLGVPWNTGTFVSSQGKQSPSPKYPPVWRRSSSIGLRSGETCARKYPSLQTGRYFR